MSLVRPIITSILLVYVRIRIINTIFSEKKIRIGITLKVFGLGIIIVGSLFGYGYLLSALGIERLLLTKSIEAPSMMLFIGYCTIGAGLITIIFKNRYRSIAQILLIGLLVFIAIAYGGFLMGMNTVILYYLISAYAEEYMKYSAGNNMQVAEKSPNENNLIFYCILIGLGFSAVENILYIIQSLISSENISIANIIIGRGLVSTLIHIVSTGLIAFIMIRSKRTESVIVPIILGIIGGFGLHSIYNISLQYNLSYVTIPMVILSFFLMTYLTFQTDMIYKQQQQ